MKAATRRDKIKNQYIKQDLKAEKGTELKHSDMNLCYIWMTTVFFGGMKKAGL
jgi:hypothetical protein